MRIVSFHLLACLRSSHMFESNVAHDHGCSGAGTRSHIFFIET